MTLLLSSSPKFPSRKHSASGVRPSVSRQGSTTQTAQFVQALHDHLHTDEADESCLFFRKGAIIEVVARDASGWWDGLCDGHRGWFPSSFVGRIGEALRTRADFDGMPRRELNNWHKRSAVSPSPTFVASVPKKKCASPLSSIATSKTCRWQESMEDVLRHTSGIANGCQSTDDFDFQGATFNLITSVRHLLEDAPVDQEEFQTRRDAILHALEVLSSQTTETEQKATDKKVILASVNHLSIEITSYEEMIRTAATSQRRRTKSSLRDSKLSIDSTEQTTCKLLDHQARIDDLAESFIAALQYAPSARLCTPTDKPTPVNAVQHAKDAVHNAINDLISAFKKAQDEPFNERTSLDTKHSFGDSFISTLSSPNTITTPISTSPKHTSKAASISESISSVSLFGSVSNARPRTSSFTRTASVTSPSVTRGEESEESHPHHRHQRTISTTSVSAAAPTVTQETSTLAQQYQRSGSRFATSQPTIAPSIVMTGSRSTPSRPEGSTSKPARKTSVPSIRPTPSTSERSVVSSSSTEQPRKRILLTTLRQLQSRRSKMSLRRKKSKELPIHLKERAYSEDELIPTDEGQIRGATVQVLIDRLTSHDVYLDHLAEPSFFYSFRHFSEPLDVANLLIKRFRLSASEKLTSEELESWHIHVQLPVQQKVLYLIKIWFKRYYNHAKDQEAQQVLLAFVKSSEVEQALTKAEAQQLARRLEKAVESIENTLAAPIPICKTSSTCTAPLLSPEIKPLSKGHLAPHVRTPVYRRTNPTRLAEQLTLMDSALYCRITATELMDQRKKKNLSEEVGSVKALVQRSSQVTEWILALIRNEKDHKRRILIVEFWVKVAEHCLALNNLNTLMSISTALNSSSFLRQANAWEEVKRTWRHKKTIEVIQNFTNFDRNFAKYRKCLKEVDPEKPCIPFLGIFLKDMVALDEGAPSHHVSNGGVQLVNFEKYTRMAKALEESVLRAQTPYPLEEARDIQHYLLQCLNDVQIEQDIESNMKRSKSLDINPRMSMNSERKVNKPNA